MVLKLYDTLTRGVRDVFPMDEQTVRFYGCGPTVYGPAHIGNFRTFVMQDVFRRVLETSGQKTFHVRNLTDVDDKTIRQSQEEGLKLEDFTDKWTARFRKDCKLLNLMSPHAEPSAVSHIPEQISLIQRLIDAGKAYQASDGSVYFKVGAFSEYGRLSRLADREITTNKTSRESSDEYDRESAADFALWKARRVEDGENYWESPWGQGRPGWHIECSAICMKHLGESFDLHSGGVDLVFPHHENEIAQVEAVTCKRFARHWFHIAHLMVEGQKMSKSLGNLYTLEDLEEKGYKPEEIRYLLLSGNYRQPLNFTFDSLGAARKALSKLTDFSRKFQIDQSPRKSLGTDFGDFHSVQEALLKDLNTPEALGRLFKIIRELSEAFERDEFNGKEDEMNRIRNGFRTTMDAFGLQLKVKDEGPVEIPLEIQNLAERRWEAKIAKDWGLADQLRRELSDRGWLVKDGKDSFELAKV
ncbi:MAG: cysteine--tRNA ligase [Verrucomicrobiota bacterium]|nr:cysteine--tRNA ligase [Verrucomicrobiota bacterium]MEC8243541.1 cysteine--tRNA ligase [Verrucomicrobiota bacterium]